MMLRRAMWVVATLLLAAPSAWAAKGEETPGQALAKEAKASKASAEKGEETPGQALAKEAKASKANAEKSGGGQPELDLFSSGGIFQVTRPTSDLDEPLPQATAKEFERRGYKVVQGKKVQLFVDRAGQIYKDRVYQGVIPGIKNSPEPGLLKRLAKRKRNVVLWDGFQPMRALSRVFWLLSSPAPRFQVTKLGDKGVEVFFPGARVPYRNDIRTLPTAVFPGPVAQVKGARVKGGVRYLITLKHPTNYLYRFDAPYLYLDFETQ